MSGTGLYIEFCDDERNLLPHEDLWFGRGSTVDLEIDNNPLLHRRLGRIYHRQDGWWLRNEG